MTDWDAGGWSGARQAQEDAWLATTPAERLAWLEEAIAFRAHRTRLRSRGQRHATGPTVTAVHLGEA